MSEEQNVFKCTSCGAVLRPTMNQSITYCPFCGTPNEIASHKMGAKVATENLVITAETNIESILNSTNFQISSRHMNEASRLLNAAILAGHSDYRIYILKAQIDLSTNDNQKLIESLSWLQKYEAAAKGDDKRNVEEAIKDLMKYQGYSGMIPLHVATFMENYDMTVFCVEHGADVNALTSVNSARVTPISIMYVYQPGITRNKSNVSKIESYLIEHGATKDKSLKLGKAPKPDPTPVRFNFGMLLLWIFLTPVAAIITFTHTKMRPFFKILWIGLFTAFYIFMLVGGLRTVFGGITSAIYNYTASTTSSSSSGKTSADAVAYTVDTEGVIKDLIRGYNNYGYFGAEASRTQKAEGESGKDIEGTITYSGYSYKDKVHYFDIKFTKNGTALGNVLFYCSGNSLLSNDEIVTFAMVSKNNQPKLTEKITVLLSKESIPISGLKTDEFIRYDPRDYKDVKEIGECKVKAYNVDDKRPGAEFVSVRRVYDIYKGDELIASVKYVLVAQSNGSLENTHITYDTNKDKYLKPDYVSMYWVADFQQDEVLDKTGILFNAETKKANLLFGIPVYD